MLFSVPFKYGLNYVFFRPFLFYGVCSMKPSLIEQLIGATNPSDFVGRKDLIDNFHEVLRDFARGNKNIKWVHISGSPGSGKTSLLRKLRMDTEMERIATGLVETPISPENSNKFLSEVKQVIDEMAPEWRSFIQRKRNVDISSAMIPPEFKEQEATEADVKKMVDSFFDDLDKVNKAMIKERFKHGLFLDDLDRLLPIGYFSVLKAFKKIAKRLYDEDYHILLVTTSSTNALGHLGIKDNSNYVLHLQLAQFDFTEAELMIRRKGKLVRGKRDDVVQASTRYPFDLSLRQLIESMNLDSNNLNDKTITETFGFTKEEVNVFQDISKYSVNLFKLEDFLKSHSKEILDNLTENLVFVTSQDGYFAVNTNSLFELIKFVFKPIDARTEVILILNRLKDQAEIGQLPSSRDMAIVTQHFSSIEDDSLIFELSSQVGETAKAALEGKLIYTAWELLDLATIGLARTNDFEKIADLQETLAKGFSRANQEYFSAKAFQMAGKYFDLANIEWRSVSNYREAGQKYKEEADRTDPKIFHYAIRSMLVQSIDSYMKAKESAKANSVKNEAKTILKDFVNHVDYFEKLEVLNE